MSVRLVCDEAEGDESVDSRKPQTRDRKLLNLFDVMTGKEHKKYSSLQLVVKNKYCLEKMGCFIMMEDNVIIYC